MEPHIKAPSILRPRTPPHFGCRKNMGWDALHSPNAKHVLVYLLGINLKGYWQENQESSYSSHGNANRGTHVVNFGKAISFSVSNDLMNCIVLLH